MEEARRDFEREYIRSVLNKTGWRITDAARRIGIDRTTLFRKMRKLGIKKGKLLG